MPERARVTSLEAIEHFRARLIVYREKAGRALDEIGEAVTRTRLWLENDAQRHWEEEIRRRTRELEQRQQEAFSARLSGLRETSTAQQAAVQKARRALREAEEKLRRVRQWQRQFDHRVEPAARQVEKLRHTLGPDLGRAIAWLNDVMRALSAYVETHPPATAPATPEAAQDEAAPAARPPDAPQTPGS
jgi:chromosome segregation ATPase